MHETKLNKTLLPRGICAIGVPHQGPVGILNDFIFERVMNEGGMVQGVWSAPGASSLNC